MLLHLKVLSLEPLKRLHYNSIYLFLSILCVSNYSNLERKVSIRLAFEYGSRKLFIIEFYLWNTLRTFQMQLECCYKYILVSI